MSRLFPTYKGMHHSYSIPKYLIRSVVGNLQFFFKPKFFFHNFELDLNINRNLFIYNSDVT